MARPSPKAVLEAFCAVVQEELAEGNDVTLPNLGTIKVEHTSSAVTNPDGTDDPTWSPPKRIIAFVPNDSSSIS